MQKQFVFTVEFVCFHPDISGHYLEVQPDCKSWSDWCIFHSLIPPNASLPSLIHLCQWLNPVQSDTRACGWEQVCGISDGVTGPLQASNFQMWHAYEWKYWACEEVGQSSTSVFFFHRMLSVLRGLKLKLLSTHCLSMACVFVSSSCFQCPWCGSSWKHTVYLSFFCCYFISGITDNSPSSFGLCHTAVWASMNAFTCSTTAL